MSTDQKSGSNRETLEARIAVLEELFVRLAQAGATESILDHGFKQVSRRLKTVSQRLDNIAHQVEPLRALGPEVPKLEWYQEERVHYLEAALVSPNPRSKPEVVEEPAVSIQIWSAS